MTTSTRTLLCVLLLVLPVSVSAQTDDAAADQGAQIGSLGPALTPSPNRWRLEMTGGFFREAWDMNSSREHLVGASVGVTRQLSPAWNVSVETHLLHVNQMPEVDAFLPAATLVFRWRPYRTGTTSLFVEGGGGVSYASNEIPDNGTRFNYVSQTGVGMTRALNARIDLVGGLRWLHVSNNSLVSHSRNPDIQAVGLYLGWQLR